MQSKNKAKVLIVDDEEIVRASCRKLLQPHGYRVSEAENAGSALKLMEATTFDLVLSDLKLPDASGIELLKDIKEVCPDTEVILLTGYGTVSTAVEAMKLGAYDYIEKPFRPEELVSLSGRAIERKSLREENIRLKKELSAQYIKNIVGTSKAMEKVFRLIGTVAPTASTVLITGESGTGKELVARAIHYNSPRKDRPFVIIDCGTLAGELIESELFGHKKGAFTGAVTDKKGLIEEAEGGTLFLDEIGNLPLALQSKLLRVLQEKEYRPVGDKKASKVDSRFITATNKDLSGMVKAGTFREDLFYRLDIFPIHVPPLRERREDIPLLAYHFLNKYSDELGKEIKGISAEAMRILSSCRWPGNIRELENTIQRAILLADNDTIKPETLAFLTPLLTELSQTGHIPRNIEELKERKKDLREKSIEEVERVFILEALKRNEWNISKTASDVGMQRSNFHALIKKHGISRPK
ncbi:Response regulator of zinc sigma-54-dependent two-component system [hydrothermal vent metagenome]|uniref:Response regulator of zinc sigma-54-dependent two-component system n=1 Tax=hydrothermal vent metagenome TaxID=652676 RepID=A0A3B1CRP0_9ZZZZ